MISMLKKDLAEKEREIKKLRDEMRSVMELYVIEESR